ncbi:hypothetical protein DID88_008702 [Monilinia fructigena]|uniref:EH domain-containing protein n=1 Tax=Monilinia fructigena TaxID=38457 RepID=A0A395J751_9HELO|nr:hypothetical protein DID88_008702 [Monilinia fructigena]
MVVSNQIKVSNHNRLASSHSRRVFNLNPLGMGTRLPLQPNFTGYPFQAQPTGYSQPSQPGFLGGQQQQFNNAPQQQSFQTGAPPMPQIPQIPQQFQQPQQAQLPQAPPAAPAQQPQATGFAAMADSFRSSATEPSKPRGTQSFKGRSKDTDPQLGMGKHYQERKSRDLLLRSKLDGNSLSQIWTLADTTRSGQLHFPEFALAMYLCNLKLVGKALPSVLPDQIKNEVSSMVDIINFGIEDDGPAATNAPNFDGRQKYCNASDYPAATTNAVKFSFTHCPNDWVPWTAKQLLGGVSTAADRFPRLNANRFSWAARRTAASADRARSEYVEPRKQRGGMIAPLNSQPTGVPGQWGLVNAPASGLPNIDLLQSRMMPQQGREQGNFTTAGITGNAVIPWAVTKEEKTRYDSVFKAWDGFGKGFIGGDVAIEGKLNMDEFAVAMHLIYRKLNGYPLPAQLPPELVPPSTRNFNDSIGAVKSLLHQESDFRKNSGATLLPQKTGAAQAVKMPQYSRITTMILGIKSSARRRLGATSPRPSSPGSSTSNDELSIDQLKKKIREKQVILDAIDFKDENAADEDDALDRKDRREAEELYRRIRRIQEDIDAHPDASLRNTLLRVFGEQKEALPMLNLNSSVRLKDAKAHPGSASSIVGTGPGGAVTESDRLKARAKAMMQQRSAALTGKKIEISNDDLDAPKRLEEENLKIRTEKENNERMVQDVEESVRDFSRGLEDSLKEGGESSSSEHEKRRWEDGLGVEDEVKDFIFDLQRSSRSAKVRTDDRSREPRAEASRVSPAPAARSETLASQPSSIPTPSGGTYSQYKTPEDRAAYIKQQAEQRMAERLAALGIRAPSKPGETTQQRLEREKNERAAKLKQAEEEDAKREAERQARIAEEQGAARSDASERKAEEDRILKEQKAQIIATNELEDDAQRQENELAKEREAAQARVKALEEQMKAGKLKKEEEKKKRKALQAETKQQEARLAAQRAEIEAAQARERELQRQLEAIDDSDSSDDDEGPEQVTPQVSTPTQGSQKLERKEVSPPPPPPSIPVIVSPVPAAAETTSLPPPTPQVTSPVISPPAPADTETRNPFLKKMAQSGEAPTAPTASTASTASNNPFHRLPSQDLPQPAPIQVQPTGNRPSRVRPEEDDDWSVVGSDKEDDSSDDEGPGAGGAHGAPGGPPPPPPPPPAGMGAPPPPPMPPMGGASSALPAGGRPAGFLGEIQMGKALKKTQN